MKLSIVTLAAGTIVLAASTIYLARALGQERERNEAVAASAADAPPAVPAHPVGPESPPTASPSSPSDSPAASPVSAPGNDTQAQAAAESAVDRRNARNREQAAAFLRLYDNPETRAKLLEERIGMELRTYASLRPQLDIDSERFDRFIKVLAEQQIDRRVRAARCLIDPNCTRPDFADSAERRQAIVDVLGDKNVAKLVEFGRERSRSSVFATLQARLGPKHALSPEQIDDLTNALFDEVARTTRDLESHGHETRKIATRYGVIVYASDTKTFEERMASAAASIDRIRDRAGTLLYGEQLTIFNQTQDDLLLVFGPHARVGVAAFTQGFEEP